MYLLILLLTGQIATEEHSSSAMLGDVGDRIVPTSNAINDEQVRSCPRNKFEDNRTRRRLTRQTVALRK